LNSTDPYKPKLVVILSRFPYPTEKGDKLRAYYQIRELSKKWELYLICLSETDITPEQVNEVKSYTKEIHIFKLNKLLIYLNVFKQFFRNKPFQVGYFYQRRIHTKIKKILNKVEPDHIYCQLIRATEYVKSYHNCPKTLDYMDTLSAGIKRRISSVVFYKKWLFKSEWKRLSNYENIIFDYFELHTIISKQDRDLIAHPNKAKIKIIPNGVSEHFFAPILNNSKTHDIIFTGNLNYPPNIAAVNYLVTQIIPEAEKRNLNLKILVSGANPSAEINKLKTKIDLTGWVEDIRTSYSRGKIFVAPMFIGTGLQNKLLEAMATSLPCITTSLANNALGASPNEVCLAETPVEFVNWIEKLLNDKVFADHIATNGCNYVKQNFNWEHTTAKLSDEMMTISK